MKRNLQYASFVILAALLSACATLTTSSPEAQIKSGADMEVLAITVATTLLRNDRITVVQAKSYRVLLEAGRVALNDSNVVLLTCRKKTGSTQTTSPDPCKPSVQDMIGLALSTISSVKTNLDAKQ